MKPRLIGYFPKRVAGRPDWLNVPAVAEICSVSNCISQGPENWSLQWAHNEMWLYDSEDRAHQVIDDAIRVEVLKDDKQDPPWHVELSREHGSEFSLFAYYLFPMVFTDGKEARFQLPKLNVVVLPDAYQRLGYDVVSRSLGNAFECSPLSCNGLAKEIPVNRWCLVEDAAEALEVARKFSKTNPEPGPFFVVEVWRRTRQTEKYVASGAKRFEWAAQQLKAIIASEMNASNAFRPNHPSCEQWALTARHGRAKPIRLRRCSLNRNTVA